MPMVFISSRIRPVVVALWLLALAAPTQALTDSFTYQGSLDLNGQPADGMCDFNFTLWDAAGAGSPPAGGNQLGLQAVTVAVNDGIFNAVLDFGAIFNSSDRWLQIAARCPAGAGSFTTLGPRQQLRPAPFASYAKSAGDVACSGCVEAADLANASVASGKIAANAVGTSEIANGSIASADIADGTVAGADILDGTIAAADIDATVVQRRVTGTCVGFGVMSQINQDGTVLCAPPATGDITSVSGGAGITGGGLSGDVSLGVAFGGGGSATTVARSDHNHVGQTWSGSVDAILDVINVKADSAGLFVTGGPGMNARGVYGTAADGTGVAGYGPNGTGILGQSIGGTGVLGSSTSGTGVEGRAFGANKVGVFGIANNTSGIGVHGKGNANLAVGVRGESTNAQGVYGTSTSAVGVLGVTNGTLLQNGSGLRGEASVASGVGIYGLALNGAIARGVWGVSNEGTGVIGDSTAGAGVAGSSTGAGPGVRGTAEGSNGVGVQGTANTGGSAVGVRGTSSSGRGVSGVSQGAGSSGDGVYGEAGGANGTGVHGVANNGANAYGVWGQSTDGYAGYFNGKVQVAGNLAVTGTLSKSAGSFKIDHPLDPANKYLSHSFVESPDMKNMYDGTVVLDEAGEATVELPPWFEALNRDFRYQLTCIGGHAPVFIADEVHANQFRIAGGSAGLKVSWQVTGTRHDAYANEHRIQVEEEKPQAERGRYLHPTEAGAPEAMAMSAAAGK